MYHVTTKRIFRIKLIKKCSSLQLQLGILLFAPSKNFDVFRQGLFQRPDCGSAIRIPLGIVPAGSGNGLARSLAHVNKEKYDKGE
jgi:sphingosine kinase